MRTGDLKLRIRALISPRTVERELDEELAFHLECETRKLIAAGAGPAEARQRALARFGPVPLAADRCRDQRGISFVETLARDLRFAWRTLRRTPLVALTVVSTIALGLGVVTVAFTFFNAFFFQVDAVRNPGELFAVERLDRPGSRYEVPFSRSEYEAIRRETDVFTDVAAARPSFPTRIDGRAAVGMFVSGNFFDLLGVTAARGRTLTEADNDDGGRAVIVLSHEGWEQLFDADPAVVGRQLVLNGRPYVVIGVMRQGFRGLRQAPPHYWAPLALVEQFRPAETRDEGWVDVIGRLKPGTSPDAAAAVLTAWASAQPKIRKPGASKASREAGPLDGIVAFNLREARGVIAKDRREAMAVFVPILFAFGLILMIGCANVANLLLARGLARHREIGIRLSLGATRSRIVRQLLTENLLLSLVAAVLAFLIARALLAGSVQMVMSILPPEFTEPTDSAGLTVPPADWRVWAFLVGGAFVSTVMFGLLPALQSTRLELVRALRGDVTKDGRPGRVRHMLIGSQVTASALLLVCAAVFLRSTYSSATAHVGLRTDDTLVVRGMTESTRTALIRALEDDPSISSVAASWPEPMRGDMSTDAGVGDTTVRVGCRLVSPEYFDLLGISVLRGRTFAAEERGPASAVVVVSDAVAQRFWPHGDALGQSIRLSGSSVTERPSATPDEPHVPAQAYTVIGVVRDVRSALKIFEFDYSGIYLPTTVNQAHASFVLRVHGDPDATRRALLDRLMKIDPALGEIASMRMMAGLEGAILEVLLWLAVGLGSLALTLTVSGLFSVLSYLVEQRRREIGVRMALGATPREIVTLVVSQSMRPIGIGILAGGGLAAALATVLLATPLADTISAMVHPYDPLAYAIGLAVIIATCLAAAFVPARRAAHIDPNATLRAD
jgi:putative ABC transport system permease protein